MRWVDETRRPYLVPRQVVARTEIMGGVGPAEAGIVLLGLGLGFGAQWLLGVLLRGLPLTTEIFPRVIVGLALGGSGWILTRPSQGGRLLDYLAAIVRYYRRRGNTPYLYGPPAGSSES